MPGVRVFEATLLLLLTATATSLVYPQPRSTLATSNVGWNPRPTQAPVNWNYGSIHQRDLFGRQAGSVDTCGYTDGNEDSPFTCSGACSSFVNGFFNCCPTDSVSGTPLADCYPATACLPYAASNGYTGLAVLFSAQTLLCPRGSPACITTLLYGANTDTTLTTYWCAESTSTIILYQAPTEAPVTVTRTTSNKPLSTPSSTTSSSTSSDAASPASSPSGVNGQGNGGGNAGGSSNTGAIAGGVVGGVAAVLFVVLIIWLLHRRKQKEKDAAMPEIAH